MDDLVYTHTTGELRKGGTYANPTVVAQTDPASNLVRLWSALENRTYCGAVRFQFRTFELGRPADRLQPMVTRFYPTYQETIYGTEGVIVAQRVFVPFRAGYSDAVCWLLDLQAEGHRLLQVDVDITWGSEKGGASGVRQRYQDGLVVALDRGNTHGARVFGAHGAPTTYELVDGRRARLQYHILIEGYVHVPFILTIAPAGEQLAWNGFLALGEITLVFRDTVQQMGRALEAARVMVPAAPFNRGLEWARVTLMRSVRRGPEGLALIVAGADDRVDTVACARAAEALDWLDPTLSREVLDTLQRVAQGEQGGLAAAFDLHDGTHLGSPDTQATAAFVHLAAHHAVVTGAEALTAARDAAERATAWLRARGAATGEVLHSLALLTGQAQDAPLPTWSPLPTRETEPTRLGPALARVWAAWEERVPASTTAPGEFGPELRAGMAAAGIIDPADVEASQAGLRAASAFLRAALEGVLGITPLANGTLRVHPHPPAGWPWMAALNLPHRGRHVHMILHDGTLYTDHPVETALAHVLCDTISPLPAEGLALLVRVGDRQRLFIANPGDEPWHDQVNVPGQAIEFDLTPGTARWVEVGAASQ